MTRKQSWALFCATGLDCRGLPITVSEAGNLIDRCNSGEIELVQQTLLDMGASGKPKAPKKDWDPIWQEAYQAGLEAGAAAVPKPMGVVNEQTGQSWVANEGLCGFAEVKVAGNTSFGRWAKKNAGFKKAYDRGLYFWVSEFGQSYTRKVACANKIAEVLKSHGIEDAYATSRLD